MLVEINLKSIYREGEVNLDGNMENIIDTQPAAAPVIHALRNIGYKAQTAIADIIDNSIDAKATSVDVHFEYGEGNGYILIVDNGIGMHDEELQRAMTLGSKDSRETRSEKELGRYGMGLKTASFSLGKRLSIISKQDNNYSERSWDLDIVSESDKWLLSKVIPTEIQKNIPNIEGSSGTIIYIDKLDRFSRYDEVQPLKKNSYFKKIERIKKHLELVYHLLLEEKVTIRINDNILTGWDPFLLNNSEAIRNKIIEGEKQVFRVNKKKIVVQPYVLPHPTNYNSTELALAGGIKGWREQQGFYIYREDRLVTYGDWLGLFKKDSLYDLVRIRVDFKNISDDDWKIDLKKTGISIPDEAKENLESIGKYYRKISQDIMLYRNKKSSSSRKKKMIGTLNTWELEEDSTQSKYVLNRLHPILDGIIKNIDEETSNALNLYLQLVELGAPMNLLEMDNLVKNEEDSIDEKTKKMVISISDSLLSNDSEMDIEELTEILLLLPKFEFISRDVLKEIIKKDVIYD